MANPSTVWAQLSLPASPVGSIPFVTYDTVTVVTDVQYFWYNQTAHQLSVQGNNPYASGASAGDQTGSDTINTYWNIDSYWPWSSAVTSPLGANGTTAGHTVSSSRGTGPVPVISQSLDFIGKFSGWCYTGASNGTPVGPVYQEIAGINIYAAGTTGSINGIGGELRIFTKADNGTQFESFKFTTTGNFVPINPSTTVNATACMLGAPNYGFAGFYLAYQVNVTYYYPSTLGTTSTPAGRVKMSAGSSSFTMNNSLINANSVVLWTLESNDATATYIRWVDTTNQSTGVSVVHLNANSTSTVQLSYIIISG